MFNDKNLILFNFKDEPDDTKKIEVLENLQLQNVDQVQQKSPTSDSSDSSKEAVKPMNFLSFTGIDNSAILSVSEPQPTCAHIPVIPQSVPPPAPHPQKLDVFETDSSSGVKKKKKDDNSQANLIPQTNQIGKYIVLPTK